MMADAGGVARISLETYIETYVRGDKTRRGTYTARVRAIEKMVQSIRRMADDGDEDANRLLCTMVYKIAALRRAQQEDRDAFSLEAMQVRVERPQQMSWGTESGAGESANWVTCLSEVYIGVDATIIAAHVPMACGTAQYATVNCVPATWPRGAPVLYVVEKVAVSWPEHMRPHVQESDTTLVKRASTLELYKYARHVCKRVHSYHVFDTRFDEAEMYRLGKKVGDTALGTGKVIVMTRISVKRVLRVIRAM